MRYTDKVIDLDSEDGKKKARVLDELNTYADALDSWDDLYDVLHRACDSFRAYPCPDAASKVVHVTTCFALALEALPEEGDPRIVCRKMHEIMVCRSDLHGDEVFIGTEAEADAAFAERDRNRAQGTGKGLGALIGMLVAAGVSGMAVGSAPENEDTPEPNAPGSSSLH